VLGKFRLIVRSLFLALFLTVLAASPAYADAYGIVPVRTFDYTFGGVKVVVPTGFFFQHSIHGKDRTITSEQGDIVAMGPAAAGSPFCNWRIDFQYLDTDGTVYQTDRGPISNTCGKYEINRLVSSVRTLPSYGKACAIFYVSGTERARQCHYIAAS
jgi:hypothetical protein